ncbi:alpha/beta fold hydrolase [Candidatus Mycoplasma mahonii]|uniref:alpha/beta fold hydrolase n=1 Tax=Candidatus Mycoplasma mahonii TaxID=3004105 RepID=UPI0026E96DB4|nr:alpha/beta hydrolase [Candidatus Mycoplasma mahonii]WKX02449.1 alpha/beta hydrolase [Candidatus Mycoplasma mahonii]
MYSFKREHEEGKRDLLFIHGYGATGTSFNKLKKYKRTFNIITINLPFNKMINNKELSIETYIDYVNKFVDEKGLIDFDVVGHSLGGPIALGITKAKKRLLIAPLNPFVNNKEKWLLARNMDDATNAMKNIVYKYEDHWSDDEINSMANTHMLFVDKNNKFISQLVKKQLMDKDYYQTGLSKLFAEKDFYVIGGENDQYVSMDSMIETTKQFNKKLFKIKECGHSPIFEKPEKIRDIIESVLKVEVD